MADRAGTIERIVAEFAGALVSVTRLLGQEVVLETLARLGVAFPDDLLANPAFNAARQNAVGAASALAPELRNLTAAITAGEVPQIVSLAVEVLAKARAVVMSFDDLRSALQSAGPGLPGITPAQIAALTADFPRKLLDLVLADQLDIEPGVGSTLMVLGLVERVPVAGDPTDPAAPDHEAITLRYDRIGRLLGGPEPYFRELYDWGAPGFDGSKLFPVASEAIARLGVPSVARPAAPGQLPKLEAFAFDLRPTSLGAPGLEVEIVMPVSGAINQTFALSPEGWTARVMAGAALRIGTQGTIRAPLEISLRPPAGELAGDLEVRLEGRLTSPLILIGQADGSRLEVGAVDLGAGLSLVWDSAAGAASVSPRLAGSLTQGRLLISTEGADGFLQTILSGLAVDAGFDVGFAWDLTTGLRFEGSSALEIGLPIHVSLGPVEIPTLYLVARFEPDRIPIQLAADLNVHLGPLNAVVVQSGAGVRLSFPPSGGNAGPVQVDFSFKPPSGVGLALDGGGLKGGGFLSFDDVNERYAGILELSFQDLFSLKAIGLIETRLPGGEPGFSLLIVISAEFTPIQLGYGFTLIGVGGLLGLNRTAKIDALRTGIKTNALSSVLFPQNIVENASRIISDLQQIFPPEANRFVFGPMAKLGWGTPTLLSIELGLIIEVPSPVRIALLGVFRALIPAEETAVIRIQVNFLGAWEEDKQLISFDAGLFDSKIVLLPLTGDMAFRLAYGDNPNFLASVGGFHPAYSPPPLPLPALERITIHLIAGDNPRLVVAAYFAVTSNTVQFGARLEVLVRAGKFNVYGFLGLDALFQFSPFAFTVEVAGGFAVRVGSSVLFSIGFRLQLSGPTPWSAHGTASFRLLFVKVKVRLSKTWGEERDTTLPDVEVLPKLIGALADKRNWEAQLPPRSNLLVSVREIEAADRIVAHPAGVLTVSQKVVPLDTSISRFSSQKPADARRFSIVRVHSNGTEFKKITVEEFFAPAQFEELSDAQKLSRRSFEKMPAGVRVSSQTNDIQFSRPVRRELRYETIVIDTRFRISRLGKVLGEGLGTFLPLLRGNAVAKSRLSFVRNAEPVLAPGRIQVDQEGYTVVSTGDLRPFDGRAGFRSETGAHAHMDELIRNNPGLQGTMQVVPNYEVERAA